VLDNSNETCWCVYRGTAEAKQIDTCAVADVRQTSHQLTIFSQRNAAAVAFLPHKTLMATYVSILHLTRT
jgi:hypothetical protein